MGGLKICDIDKDEEPNKAPVRTSRASSPEAASVAPSLCDSVLGDDSLTSAPDVEPPKCSKEKLYEDPDIFKDFDNRAIEVIHSTLKSSI